MRPDDWDHRSRPSVRPSLRRRLTLAFAGAIILTATVLALSAYFLTASAQRRDALDRALDQSRFNLFLADSTLPAAPTPSDFTRLLDAFAIRGDFSALLLFGDEIFVSGPQVSLALITPELAGKVAEGRLGYQSLEVGGVPALAVGGRLRGGQLTAYFFYPQTEQMATLARLRNVLAITAAVLAVLGVFAGYLLGRRVLRPVREASQAAALMACGQLAVRLPEGPDEFGAMNASFNRMAASLQARILDLEEGRARERRLVADAAHELRTPVSALVGEISLLTARLEAGSGAPSPEVARLATLLAGDIGRLRRLVEDLLEVGRLDADAVETSLEEFDVIAFLHDVLRANGWTSAVSVNTRSWDSRRPLPVKADKRLLERVILNLVRNALQHGAPPVTVDVGVGDGNEATAAQVQVAVTDNGPGIRPEQLPHLFDRFYKGDPSRSTAQGSGLGLAIARSYARLMGGDLEALPGQDVWDAGPGAQRDARPDLRLDRRPGSMAQVSTGATFVLRLRRAEESRPEATNEPPPSL